MDVIQFYIQRQSRLWYVLMCNNNEVHRGQFWTESEAQRYYKAYVTSWTNYTLEYRGYNVIG